jgi:hypothetical protein
MSPDLNPKTPPVSDRLAPAGPDARQLAAIQEQLELLADDALTPEQEAQLLRELDAIPGGWRLCAVTLLEVRAIEKALRGWGSPLAAGAGPSRTRPGGMVDIHAGEHERLEAFQADKQSTAEKPGKTVAKEVHSSFQSTSPKTSDLDLFPAGTSPTSNLLSDCGPHSDRAKCSVPSNRTVGRIEKAEGGIEKPKAGIEKPELVPQSARGVSAIGAKEKRSRRWIGSIAVTCGVVASFLLGMWVERDFLPTWKTPGQLPELLAGGSPPASTEEAGESPTRSDQRQTGPFSRMAWVPLVVASDSGSYPVAIPVTTGGSENVLHQPSGDAAGWPPSGISPPYWLPMERIFREGHALRYDRQLVEWLTLDGVRVIVPVEEVSILPQDFDFYQ